MIQNLFMDGILISRRYYFLLGGHDLEMLEICKILQERDCSFSDRNLFWGARLSDYEDLFDEEKHFIGIELEADIPPPTHYTEIDHHGKNAHKPSALEQVLNLLDPARQLTRWQQLVVANDCGYITAMQAMGATSKEIDDIRSQDRIAQGITSEDERLAQLSVARSQNESVYSLTHKFSAVSDLLVYQYNQYLIYNDKTVTFYGYNISELQQFLPQFGVDAEQYYFGGGKNGFLGLKSGILSKKKIQELVEAFMYKTKQHSYHTFMFPFVFEGEMSNGSPWQHKLFEIKSTKAYNEYVYFYKHVQDALYETNESSDQFTSKYYEYPFKEGSYTIDCVKGSFTLKLDGLSLRVFNTNIAILSFHLVNETYIHANDILAINDFGRRIYPQFLDAETFTNSTKNSILAKQLCLEIDGTRTIETFSNYDNLEGLTIQNKCIPKFIEELIEAHFDNYDSISPVIDDRMFVISQYNNDAISSKLSTMQESSYAYETDDWWYKYVFIDGMEKTCQSKPMSKHLIRESSYERWVEYGTLFGISRYAFVVLSTNNFGNTVLLAHTQSMYYQIVTLLLAYRASIIKFSDEIQDTTSQKKGAKSPQSLYEDYLNFLNKLYFKEVTAQEQGIELYQKALEVMNIERYMADLDHEINELHSYVTMSNEQKRNKRLEFIGEIGAVFLPPSLLAGMYGMNVFAVSKNSETLLFTFVAIFLSAVFGWLSIKKRWAVLILGVIFVAGMFCIPMQSNSDEIEFNSTKGAKCQIIQ